MSKTAIADEQLLDQFVSSFKTLDEMNANEVLSPITWQMDHTHAYPKIVASVE